MKKNFDLYALLAGFFLLVSFSIAPSSIAQVVENGCMEEVAQFGLNCTANDVQLAGVALRPDGSPDLTIEDDGCAFPGDMVTFTARFEVLLTAQERHDIGIFFATDGDLNGDGAVTGSCSISTIPYAPEPFLDLDGFLDGGFCDIARTIPCETDRDCRSSTGVCNFEQDVCGDIDNDHNPLFPVLTITTECIDPDGNRTLNLPNCTSWRQPGANELCTGPLDAFPGSPSKCRCDLGFEVPILVPPAELAVTKTADPNTVPESGGNVTFTIVVLNQSPFATVTLNSLTDSVFGDIADPDNPLLVSTTCTLPQTLPAEDATVGGVDTYSCSFVAWIAGQPGTETNVVTASGIDENDNVVEGTDDEDVVITDVPAVPLTIVKSVTSDATLPEPGGDFDFQVVVTNGSTVDTATVTDLDDTFLADLQTSGSCVDADGDVTAPFELSPGESLTCTFTVNHTGQPDSFEDNVTVAATDDDGDDVGGVSNTVTVEITDVPPAASLTKTALAAAVTYQVVVTNDSTAEALSLNALMDDKFLDIADASNPLLVSTTCSVPQTLQPKNQAGDTYTCSFVAMVNAGDTPHTNTLTGTVSDNDVPTVVKPSDSATVDLVD